MDIFKYVPYGLRAIQHAGEIEYVAGRLKPYVDMIQADAPDLLPRIKALIEVIAPDLTATTPIAYNVKWIQSSLNALGEQLVVDGDYGDATKAAVARFQAAHGLYVDKWVGVETMAVLDTLSKEKPHA